MDFQKTAVPFLSLAASNNQVKKDILKSFANIVESDWYILGKYCSEFESMYRNFHNVSHCVSVSNGLDALVIALRSLGIGPNDEVIIPSNTFIATALAVSFVGAKPILVEPSETTYNIQASNIKNYITDKTKAIIPVHLYGQACEMQDIIELAQKHGIAVVEDNAQAQGALSNGKMTGSFGDINATSFYPGKNLGAMGDAGAITTNNDELAKKARMYRNYGSAVKYVHEVKGQNSRLDELQAAVLIEKLKHLNNWNTERQTIASYYDKQLTDLGDLILPTKAESVTHVYHLYVVRTEMRDALQAHLSKYGVETLVHYPTPIHLQGAYADLGYEKGSLPISESLSNTSLSIPLYPGLTLEKQNIVINAIKSFYATK